MNKPKYQLTNRTKKKMNKEVRASAIQPDALMETNQLNPMAVLSKYPKKIQKKEKASLSSFGKGIAVERKKQRSPHSKRTTPGTVDEQSPPQIIHIEGRRWIKTTEVQVQAKKTVMRRQILKKRGR